MKNAAPRPGHEQQSGRHCEKRSDEAIQFFRVRGFWIASLRSQ
jgi:hypothetical protein